MHYTNEIRANLLPLKKNTNAFFTECTNVFIFASMKISYCQTDAEVNLVYVFILSISFPPLVLNVIISIAMESSWKGCDFKVIAINKCVSYHNMDTNSVLSHWPYASWFVLWLLRSHRMNIFNIEWKLLPSNGALFHHSIINYILRTVNWIYSIEYRMFSWNEKRLVKNFDLHSLSQQPTANTQQSGRLSTSK